MITDSYNLIVIKGVALLLCIFSCQARSISISILQVQHMRRNLDQSEAAIIQVFEEKQRVWERQMDELRQNYASRLQQVTWVI